MSTALISVSNKAGVVELARGLHDMGVKLLSTGGTARLLAEAGLPVREVAEVTRFPEMLDGRVKTLHPNIHGGLLARRQLPAHMQALAEHGIATIDLLVVNLYPFADATARADCSFADAIENIDIGGPAMLRAAAKNWADVTVLVDPADYASVLDEWRQHGASQRSTRFTLACKVFAHTAAYDGMISQYLSALQPGAEANEGAIPERRALPATLNLQMQRVQDLRYGENPHQVAAFYREAHPAPGTLALAQQVQGKELSYNNIADADAAWECVKAFDGPACVIVKHANPCGVAVGADVVAAYAKALQTDRASAFGGIVAFNRPITLALAQAMAETRQFVEVLLAPAIDDAARTLLSTKANLRVLVLPVPTAAEGVMMPAPTGLAAWDFKRVGGGLLVQTADTAGLGLQAPRVVTRRQPTAQQWADMRFAWVVAQFVKSNAIVFCADGMTLGVGAGQMSRVDSSRIASQKAALAGLSLVGSAVASDAFFPFRDGLDVVVEAGASCVIQPGGSVRDDEVIAAADERDVVMVVTGVRHFRH